MVISKQKTLTNGNKEFLVYNYNNDLLLKLEQNEEDKIGNRIVYNNKNKSLKSSVSFPNINKKHLAKKSSCLGSGSFSECMQCGWDECTSSWICGAVLALAPVQTIGFSVALCGLDTITNNL